MSQTRNVWNWIIIIEKASASVDTRNKRVDGVLCVATLFFSFSVVISGPSNSKNWNNDVDLHIEFRVSDLTECVAVFCQWMFLFDRKLFFSLLSTFYCSSAHVFFSGVRRKIEMVPLSKLKRFCSKWKTIALVSTDHVESVKLECQVGVSMADEWMNEIFLLMDGVCARRWIEKWKSFQIKFNMWWNWR